MSSGKEIFEAMTCESSAEGCDGDWRRKVLSEADPAKVRKINEALSEGKPLSEVAANLRIGGII